MSLPCVRTTVLLGLAALALVAGCIGSPDETGLDEQDTDAAPAPGAETLAWEGPGSVGSSQQIGGNVTFHEPSGAVFVEFEATLQERGDAVQASLEHPNGEAYTLVDASTTGGNQTISDWVIVPGLEEEGNALELVGQLEGSSTLKVAFDARAPVEAPDAVATNGTDERPVVAVVDSGVNVYHEAFQRDGISTADLPARIATDEGDPVQLDLDREDAAYRDAVRTDAAVWANAPSQELFHVDGTNLLGIDLRERELPDLPVLDRSGHGTMVAHAVSRENPDTLVTMITADDYDEGVRWAAQQPWIDLISLSWGPAVNAAGAAEPYATGFETHDATRQAHERGQLVFTATGNDPTLAFTDTTSGPPWVHAVSGAEPDGKGRALASGNLVDTVANWTQTLARYDHVNETTTGSGTSFATPTTAGVAAKILHEARIAADHEGDLDEGPLVDGEQTFDASELRHALNRSAVYWNTTDYEDPREGPSAPPAPTPWVNMGWGYLDGSRVAPALDGLLGEGELPDKSDQAEAFMDANLQLRLTWWNDVERPSGPT